jgi:hypothetical protein
MNAHLVAELSPEQLIRHRKMMEELRTRFDHASRRRSGSWPRHGEKRSPDEKAPEDSVPQAEE